jgi:hypothetical protein
VGGFLEFWKYRLIRWENRFGVQRDWDVRISYENQIAHELQIGISTYW